MRPTKIVCVGWNYRSHIKELKSKLPEELEGLRSEKIIAAPVFGIFVVVYVRSENRLPDMVHVRTQSAGDETAGSEDIGLSLKRGISKILGIQTLY